MNNNSTILLGLGTNIGDRLTNISKTLGHLKKHLTDINISPVYESDAMLLPNSPTQWNTPFLNIVVMGQYDGDHYDLLTTTQSIEKKMGRAPAHQKWSPRVIDIDILAIDTIVISREDLHVPHLGLTQRPFFHHPFADLFPQWRYPCESPQKGQTIEKIAQDFSDISFNTTRTDYEITLS